MPAFPGWLGWLLLLAVIWLYFQVGVLQARINSAKVAPKSRQELEAGYTAGRISRDDYERWKDQLQG